MRASTTKRIIPCEKTITTAKTQIKNKLDERRSRKKIQTENEDLETHAFQNKR